MSNEIANISPKLFEPIREKFVQLSDAETLQREVSFACQILAKNDYLAKSAPHTIQAAVLNVANIGLSLNPVLKYAYLVPRYSNASRSVECYLEPSFQGLAKLWTDTGCGKSIVPQLIWEGDEVEVDLASAEKVKKHVPFVLTGKDQGKVVAVYSIATLQDGSRECEIMSAKQVYEIRDRSESYKKFKEGKLQSCIWVTDEGEMFRKTVIRRHFKNLPKSHAFEQVAKAVKLDEEDYGLEDWQWNKIDRLVHTAHIPEDRRSEIMNGMEKYSKADAAMCIEYLEMNQPPDMMKHLKEQAIRDKA